MRSASTVVKSLQGKYQASNNMSFALMFAQRHRDEESWSKTIISDFYERSGGEASENSVHI